MFCKEKWFKFAKNINKTLKKVKGRMSKFIFADVFNLNLLIKTTAIIKDKIKNVILVIGK